MAAKRQGLVLDLPGAPDTPHHVPGVAGLYRPGVPTPVGKDGELDLEEAKELHKDKSFHLKLVEIPTADVKKAEDKASEAMVEAREGLIAATKLARGDGGPAEIQEG
jgi:hypothetical protein